MWKKKGQKKEEEVAKEWGTVATEFKQVCGEKQSYTRTDVVAFLAHLRKRRLLQSTSEKDLKAIKVVARAQGGQLPKLPLRRMSPDEARRTILSKETIDSMITLGWKSYASHAMCPGANERRFDKPYFVEPEGR